MFHGPGRLAILAGVLSFGATGAALALTGTGMPFLLAAALAAAAAGLVQWAAARSQPEPSPDRLAETALQTQLEGYRAATAALRHDLRGVISPALMVSDRLIAHQDPAVQRAGTTVVRSVERATALLASHRDTLAPEADPASGV